MAHSVSTTDLHDHEVKVRLKEADDKLLRDEARRRDVKPFALARELLVRELNQIRNAQRKEGPDSPSGNVLLFRRRAA